jgi:hypothetical protein
MKTLDKTTVLNTAVALITNNGKTTTLEVKEELRKKGYKAFQKEISSYLQDIASEENLQATDAGNHKIYSFDQSQAWNKKLARKQGDWEMNSTTHSNVIYVPSHFTRDQARQEYCNQVGAKWADTRGRKIK